MNALTTSLQLTLYHFIQDEESKGRDQAVVGDDSEEPVTKDGENSKPESPFSTLVKMTTGKNPTTFSLPPELKCNTFFPGEFYFYTVLKCDSSFPYKF